MEAQSLTPGADPGFGRAGALARESSLTEGIEARPDGGQLVPQPTMVPFWVAFGLALFFVGLLVKATVVLGLGVALAVAVLLIWTWRTEADLA